MNTRQGRPGRLPAVFVRQSVQSDGSLSAAAFEETLDGVVPPQIVILLHAAVCRLEVGVATLEAGNQARNHLLGH